MYIGGFGLFILCWLLISTRREIDETSDALWFFARVLMVIAAPFAALAATTLLIYAIIPELPGRETQRAFIAFALALVVLLALFGLHLSRQEKKEELAKVKEAERIAALPPTPLTATERGVRALAELRAEKAAANKS